LGAAASSAFECTNFGGRGNAAHVPATSSQTNMQAKNKAHNIESVGRYSTPSTKMSAIELLKDLIAELEGKLNLGKCDPANAMSCKGKFAPLLKLKHHTSTHYILSSYETPILCIYQHPEKIQ
jgi:hypothetical protein